MLDGEGENEPALARIGWPVCGEPSAEGSWRRTGGNSAAAAKVADAVASALVNAAPATPTMPPAATADAATAPAISARARTPRRARSRVRDDARCGAAS